MTLPASGHTTSVRKSRTLTDPCSHAITCIQPGPLIKSLLDELGNWRPERNKFTRRYFQAYHSHVPKAEPEEDYDDRNALYSL